MAESKALRTFLLDKENKIVAIGNPIENPNVKKFYLKLLTGKEQETSVIQTTVELSAQELDFGTFPKEETKTGEILFKNTGDKPGHFNKSLKVYGNMESSPVKLFVRGETN